MNLEINVPKLCCESCFADPELKQFIKDHGKISTCTYCEGKDVSCIPPDQLAVKFAPLQDLFYEEPFTQDVDLFENEEPQGTTLPLGIQCLWNVFSDNVIKKGTECKLLDDIRGTVVGDKIVNRLNNKTERLSEGYWLIIPPLEFGSELKYYWDIFRHDLLRTNRFFPDCSTQITPVLKNISKRQSKSITKGTILYRGRASSSNLTPKLFKIEELKAPVPDKAKAGRLNPAGIPVFYVGEDVDTVLAEVRPWVGTVVSIAQFETLHELQIVDLTNKDVYSHPFCESDLEAAVKEKDLVMLLNSAFSTPLSVTDSSQEYLPTQYVAMFMKSLGYDGVRYRSAVLPEGRNLALFDDKCCKNIGDISYHEVERIEAKCYVHTSAMQCLMRKHRKHFAV